jgi:hypothetical protein
LIGNATDAIRGLWILASAVHRGAWTKHAILRLKTCLAV